MTTKNTQPGDCVLADTRGAYGRLIQFGQALRWKRHSRWHHGAIVTQIDPDGQVWCVQMAKHGEKVKIEEIAPGRPLKIIPCPKGVDRKKSVDYANKIVGTDYGILTIVSIAITILTPGAFRIDFRHEGTLICSAAVARSWEHGGWDCPVDPFSITPAQIDELLGDTGWPYDGA